MNLVIDADSYMKPDIGGIADVANRHSNDKVYTILDSGNLVFELESQ